MVEVEGAVEGRVNSGSMMGGRWLSRRTSFALVFGLCRLFSARLRP